jgi:DNA repair protein RecN (Recombination protein N)
VAGKMIELIKIKSLAVFDDASIEFNEGLNCITGETGAGKSLVIKALTSLMGAKVSSDLVRAGQDRAVIEALFTNNGSQTVLRREISDSGRSRCYINGELATAERLFHVSSMLLHIYGQHEYQDLLSQKEQMRILEDIFCIERTGVQEAYNLLKDARQKYDDINSLINNAIKEKESLAFTLNEIESLNIHEGLENELKEKLDVSISSQELKESAGIISGMLYSDSRSVIDILSDVRSLMAKMSSKDKRLESALTDLEGVSVQVEEIASLIRGHAEDYDYDRSDIELLEARLHSLRDLKRKYASNETGLIEIKEDAKKKLTLIEDSSISLEETFAAFEYAKKAYCEILKIFLSERMKAASLFSSSINEDLAGLGMPGTVFKVLQYDEDALAKAFDGDDISLIAPGKLLEGEFMISTNVGLNMIPLARAASGGELSRIMLAIKARQRQGFEGTMVFDEIDSGIGGQAAIMIADKLKILSKKSQAIAVTHLHQVASAADTHLVIDKSIKENQTFSSARHVSGEERVAEIARMMGGLSPGDALLKHARTLVKKSRA